MRTHSVLLAILVASSCAILPAQTSNPARAVVEGDIVNASTGAPLPQARVKLWRPWDDSIYGKVDRQGHFVFPDLSPGFYNVIVEAPGFQQSRTPFDSRYPRLPGAYSSISSNQSPQATVTSTTGDDGVVHTVVTAPMLAYASISGRITDPFGDPMSGAMVQIYQLRSPTDGGEPQPATAAKPVAAIQADSRGEFRAARLEPNATYWVMAGKPGANRWTWQSTYRVTYYPAALNLASAQPLKLSAGQQVRADIQILRQAGVSVSGHLLIVWADGFKRPSFTSLQLVPSGDTANPEAFFAQTRGEFEFQDVLPGKYTLYAQTNDPLADSGDANHQKPLFGLVKEVEIGTQDMAGLDLALEPMKNLGGVVAIAGDCNPAPRVVRLVAGHTLSAGPAQAPIAADGTFDVPSVPTGRYEIRVTSEEPYDRLPLAFATKGALDVLKNGLESPWKDDGILKITVDCSGREVRK